MIKFIPNAGRVARRAYSMWFGAYLPVLWLLVPEILWAAWDIQMSPVLVWIVAFALATLAGILRVKDQGLSK